MSDIIPIFTLGAARNGTTWLGNKLALHEAIACAEHPLHHGIHESNILQHKLYWGDISRADRYIDFLQLYATEDYFLLAQGDVEYFAEHPQPSFYTFFFELMDRFARKTGCTHWTTKLDPLLFLYPDEHEQFMSELKQRYATVKWIAIKRNIDDCMRSYVYMEGRNNKTRQKPWVQPASVVLGVARYLQQYRHIEALVVQEQGLMLDFKTAISDTTAVEQRIDKYLGLEQSLGGGRPVRHKVNTSFKDGSKRKELTGPSKIALKASRSLLAKLPGVSRRLLYLFEKYKPAVSPVYRKIYKSRYFPEQLNEEFSKVGAPDLQRMIEQNDATDNP